MKSATSCIVLGRVVSFFLAEPYSAGGQGSVGCKSSNVVTTYVSPRWRFRKSKGLPMI